MSDYTIEPVTERTPAPFPQETGPSISSWLVPLLWLSVCIVGMGLAYDLRLPTGSQTALMVCLGLFGFTAFGHFAVALDRYRK